MDYETKKRIVLEARGSYSSASAAAQVLQISPSTIRRIWREAGVSRPYTRYEGNPLDVFHSQYPHYEGSRTDFRKINPSLERALSRSGQIDLAIPQFRSYTPQQRANICLAYFAFLGNASVASRRLKIPRRTIGKMWSEKDYPHLSKELVHHIKKIKRADLGYTVNIARSYLPLKNTFNFRWNGFPQELFVPLQQDCYLPFAQTVHSFSAVLGDLEQLGVSWDYQRTASTSHQYISGTTTSGTLSLSSAGASLSFFHPTMGTFQRIDNCAFRFVLFHSGYRCKEEGNSAQEAIQITSSLLQRRQYPSVLECLITTPNGVLCDLTVDLETESIIFNVVRNYDHSIGDRLYASSSNYDGASLPDIDGLND